MSRAGPRGAEVRLFWKARIPPVAMTITAVLSVVVYVFAVRSQGGLPAWWLFVLMLSVAGLAAISSILNERAGRRLPLLATTTMAAGLGLLTYTSIGGPLMITAALGLLAIVADLKQA
jgi:hypothetical protein